MDKLSAFDEWYKVYCAMKQCADKTSPEYRELATKCAELKATFNKMFE